jgi:hypothetical protein
MDFIINWTYLALPFEMKLYLWDSKLLKVIVDSTIF